MLSAGLFASGAAASRIKECNSGFPSPCISSHFFLTAQTFCGLSPIPHSGQAYVIFKTREAAEKAVTKLDEGCLLFSSGRPLVGSIANPYFRTMKPAFFGHIVLDKQRFHMLREMKDAVSTSHCSQPNTIEYDMALEWCLLQEKSDRAWEKLRKLQERELSKLKAIRPEDI